METTSPFKRWLTPRELRHYLADDWRAFDAEIRKRLLRVDAGRQLRLLSASHHLHQREWWRRHLIDLRLLDKLAGAL